MNTITATPVSTSIHTQLFSDPIPSPIANDPVAAAHATCPGSMDPATAAAFETVHASLLACASAKLAAGRHAHARTLSELVLTMARLRQKEMFTDADPVSTTELEKLRKAVHTLQNRFTAGSNRATDLKLVADHVDALLG